MTLKSDTKFGEVSTCRLKIDIRNLANFHQFSQSTRKCQNWDFDGILLSKEKMYEIKITRGVTCHDNEE